MKRLLTQVARGVHVVELTPPHLNSHAVIKQNRHVVGVC